MTSITQRLRNEGADAFTKKYSMGMWQLCADAADEIDRLKFENMQLMCKIADLRGMIIRLEHTIQNPNDGESENV